MKTIVVHLPIRCRIPKLEIFDDHIDFVNSLKSKKYLPEKTNILAFGMGGDELVSKYNDKFFSKPSVERKKSILKSSTINESELNQMINKQKKFLSGDVDKPFW